MDSRLPLRSTRMMFLRVLISRTARLVRTLTALFFLAMVSSLSLNCNTRVGGKPCSLNLRPKPYRSDIHRMSMWWISRNWLV